MLPVTGGGSSPLPYMYELVYGVQSPTKRTLARMSGAHPANSILRNPPPNGSLTNFRYDKLTPKIATKPECNNSKSTVLTSSPKDTPLFDRMYTITIGIV